MSVPRERIAGVCLAAVVGTVFGLVTGGCKPPAPTGILPVAVQVKAAEPLSRESGCAQLGSYLALAKPDQELNASFRSPGILDLIGPRKGEDWKEGMAVHRGDVLAQLARSDFINQLKSAQSRYDLNLREHQRCKQLYEANSISLREFNLAEANVKVATADLELARQALADSEIKAPFDGSIFARHAGAGEIVAAGQAVLRLGDTRNISLEVGVPDTMVVLIQVGAEFPVKIAALPDSTFMARVSEVGIAAHEETRLFKVILKIANPQGLIRAGMTASVLFNMPQSAPADGVLIPISALFVAAQDGAANQTAVFVVNQDHHAQQRLVKTGDIVENRVIVTNGLRAGESVVVVGIANLYDGAPVKAQPVSETLF